MSFRVIDLVDPARPLFVHAELVTVGLRVANEWCDPAQR